MCRADKANANVYANPFHAGWVVRKRRGRPVPGSLH